jgi:hypothetical protein
MNYDTGTGFTIDTDKLPPASISALLDRGLGHVFGNEASSRVVSGIRKAINPEKPSEVSTEAVKAFRETNSDAIAEMTRKAHEDFVGKLLEGKLGERAPGTGSGPKVDPLTKWCRATASAEIVAILRGKGAIAAGEKKMPKLDDEFELGGASVTFGALIDRRLANPKEGPRLQREGKAHLDALAKQKARAEANAKAMAEAGGESLEEMGF